MLGKNLAVALHEQRVNALLTYTASDHTQAVLEETNRASAAGALVAIIKGVSVESFNDLLDPPSATVQIDVRLYNPKGQVVATASTTGRVRRMINPFSMNMNNAVGVLVAEAIRDAAQQVVGQEPLASALSRLKSKIP